MNIKPIRGQVVVLPDPAPEPSKIIITPDSVKADNPNYYTKTGRVVALAEHSYTHDGEDACAFDVRIGERVQFGRYAGKQVTCSDDGVRYLVMTEHEIEGVLDDSTEVLHGYQAPSSDEVKSYDRDPFAERV